MRHHGQSYPLGLHGFASARDFAVVEQAADFARLRLEADAATRALYPFDFRLDAIYRLEAEALVWRLEATNLGAEPMPYALGLHPGFRWPLAGSGAPHAFIFDTAERPEVPVIAPGGLFSPERRAIPLDGRRLVRVRLAGEHRPMVIGTATADQFKKSRLMQMVEAHCRSFISDAYIPGMVAPAMDRRLRKP